MDFVSYLYLILLISGQTFEVIVVENFLEYKHSLTQWRWVLRFGFDSESALFCWQPVVVLFSHIKSSSVTDQPVVLFSHKLEAATSPSQLNK